MLENFSERPSTAKDDLKLSKEELKRVRIARVARFVTPQAAEGNLKPQNTLHENSTQKGRQDWMSRKYRQALIGPDGKLTVQDPFAEVFAKASSSDARMKSKLKASTDQPLRGFESEEERQTLLNVITKEVKDSSDNLSKIKFFLQYFDITQDWVKKGLAGSKIDLEQLNSENLRIADASVRLAENCLQNAATQSKDHMVKACKDLTQLNKGLSEIRTLLNRGIPIDEIPQFIGSRKVINVSGENGNCGPRALWLNAETLGDIQWKPTEAQRESTITNAKRELISKGCHIELNGPIDMLGDDRQKIYDSLQGLGLNDQRGIVIYTVSKAPRGESKRMITCRMAKEGEVNLDPYILLADETNPRGTHFQAVVPK